jgi:hypothetical protein
VDKRGYSSTEWGHFTPEVTSRHKAGASKRSQGTTTHFSLPLLTAVRGYYFIFDHRKRRNVSLKASFSIICIRLNHEGLQLYEYNLTYSTKISPTPLSRCILFDNRQRGQTYLKDHINPLKPNLFLTILNIQSLPQRKRNPQPIQRSVG